MIHPNRKGGGVPSPRVVVVVEGAEVWPVRMEGKVEAGAAEVVVVAAAVVVVVAAGVKSEAPGIKTDKWLCRLNQQ